MNNDLRRIEGKSFQSYIGEYFPLYSETSYGQFVIVDNTGEQSIDGLVPNTYNLFIDHIHIASGYGFASYTDFNNEIEKISYSYNNVIELLNYNENSEQISLFNISVNPINNYFTTYNSYGFATSYISLSFNKKTNNDYKYNYELFLNKYYLKYINVIGIEHKKDDLNNDITIVNSKDDFPITLNLSIGNNSNGDITLLQNEKIKISHSSIYPEAKMIIEGNSISSNTQDINIEFNDNYEEDLIIEYLYEENILSKQVFSNVLKWSEKIIPYPKSTIYENIDNAILDPEFMNNYMNIIPENDIEIEFNGGTLFTYDYIITDSNLNIEFYFNGIKSNNWTCKEKDYSDTPSIGGIYYIWTSPQKYCGAHTWKLKIKNN